MQDGYAAPLLIQACHRSYARGHFRDFARIIGFAPVSIRAYLLPPHVHAAMLEHLSADLRQAIQECIDRGPAIPADQVFAELNAR